MAARGTSIIAQQVSIEEYLFERMLYNVLYGPLSDNDLADRDDVQQWLHLLSSIDGLITISTAS